MTATLTVRTVAAGEQVTVRALLTEAFLPYEPHFPAGVFVPYLRDLLDLVHRQGRFGTFLGGPDARWRRWRKARIQPGMRASRRLASERLDPPINAPTSLDGALVEGDPVTVAAELGGEVVGTMRLYPAGAPHGVPLPSGWAMVRAVAVAPRLRRSGVAQALLSECERRARRTGATHLAFHTIDQMRDTFAFALRLGYPRRPDLDFDGGEYFGQPPGRILVKAFGRRLP